MEKPPWEVTPALTADRLQVIVDAIASVRADAREGHLQEKGDDPWVFGCRAYRRTCHALRGLASTGDHPWLKVESVGLACTLFIDGEPLKFYKGDAENPTTRSLRRGFDAAITQGTLAFDPEELGRIDGWFWLLALETHDDGTLMRAAVFQANQRNETRNLYFVTVDGDVSVLAPVVAILREGVDLAPPVVGPKVAIEQAAGNDNGGSHHG